MFRSLRQFVLMWPSVVALAALVGCDQSMSNRSSPTTAAPSSSQPGRIATPTQPASETPSANAVVSSPPGSLPTPQPPAESVASVASYRPPDRRPQHDVAAAAARGVRLYQSRRLKLFTDIEAEAAAPLPPLLDALFDEWERYFGKLPPARDGSDYQLTGYLMRQPQRFRELGMLPVTLPGFAHGKHDAQQFWMYDQEQAYYRRHLLFHEATHCFMQSMGGTTEDVPLWYLEGMAELFATHQLDENGRPSFRVVPHDPNEFVGFGRIEMIAKDVHEGRPFTLPQLTSLSYDEFHSRPSAYAWSWATCLLADRHPRYHDPFRELGRRYPAEGFATVRHELLDPVTADFVVEWTLLTRAFDYGHDFAAAAIEFAPGRPPMNSQRNLVEIAADRGWQSSGVAVTPEVTCSIRATGRVTLADQPRPWASEADGVTIRYSGGRPIGRLLGLVIGAAPETLDGSRYIGDVHSFGSHAEFSPAEAGTLYLRVNDFDNELTDNTGHFDVEVIPSPPHQSK